VKHADFTIRNTRCDIFSPEVYLSMQLHSNSNMRRSPKTSKLPSQASIMEDLRAYSRQIAEYENFNVFALLRSAASQWLHPVR
jgi:hypothetical protein